MRVFISSVRQGLEEERDALRGLLLALGHTPVRFEDFSAQDVPSREACVTAVASSDLYLLLLGPHYGYRFPETGQSATHDEWRAAQQAGVPVLVFHKLGVEADDAEQEFVRLVGDYGSGRFWASFSSTSELQQVVVEAVRTAEQAPPALDFAPLEHPLEVAWSLPETNNWAMRPLMEVHVLPVGGGAVSDRVFHQAGQRLPTQVRADGLVSQLEGLGERDEGDAIWVEPRAAVESGRQAVSPARFHALAVRRSGAVTIQFALSSDSLGSVLDLDLAATNVAAALRATHRLEYISTERAAIAIGLTTRRGVVIGPSLTAPRNQASAGMNGDPVRVQPDESVPTVALDGGAHELALALAEGLGRAFGAPTRR